METEALSIRKPETRNKTLMFAGVSIEIEAHIDKWTRLEPKRNGCQISAARGEGEKIRINSHGTSTDVDVD